MPIAFRIVGMMSTDRTGALMSLPVRPAPAKTIGICCAARWMPPWSPATEYVVLSGSVAIRSGPYGAAWVSTSSCACLSNHWRSASVVIRSQRTGETSVKWSPSCATRR